MGEDPGRRVKIDSVLSALESRLGTTPVLALRAHMIGGAINAASERCNAHELAEEIGSGSVPETRIYRAFRIPSSAIPTPPLSERIQA